MSEPFLGEVRMMGFNFAPRGWAQCDGQILPINQNQSLYSLLGTNYGGDGRSTFGLPDLRGRTPIHPSEGHALASKGGEEGHVLTPAEMPQHSHTLKASNDTADQQFPTNRVMARSTATDPVWVAPDNLVNMAAASVANAGGGQAHQNMQPYQVLNFCIAMQGLFPSRS